MGNDIRKCIWPIVPEIWSYQVTIQNDRTVPLLPAASKKRVFFIDEISMKKQIFFPVMEVISINWTIAVILSPITWLLDLGPWNRQKHLNPLRKLHKKRRVISPLLLRWPASITYNRPLGVVKLNCRFCTLLKASEPFFDKSRRLLEFVRDE